MALTAQEETDIRALLDTLAVDPEDLKRTYDLADAPVSGAILDYFLVSDENSLTEAQKIKIADILSQDAVQGQGSAISYKALTPYALSLTVASQANSGIVGLTTDAQAIAETLVNKALVPGNLPAIFDARFAKTKTYQATDFDLPAGNVDSITVTALSEMVVGKFTKIMGYLNITVTSEVANLEIVLEATQTPTHLGAFAASLYADTTRYLPQAGVLSTSSGKLKMEIGKHDNTSYGAGSYEIAIGLEYYSV